MRRELDELEVRPWLPEDLDAGWAALQDPAVRLWNGSGAGSREEAAVWLARRSEGEDHVSRAVVDRADGALVGSVSLHSIDVAQQDAEIGYWVVPSARGRRIAPRVVDALCTWAFAELDLDRVVLAHAVENPGSGRVAAIRADLLALGDAPDVGSPSLLAGAIAAIRTKLDRQA